MSLVRVDVDEANPGRDSCIPSAGGDLACRATVSVVLTSPSVLRARVLPALGVDANPTFTYGDVRRDGEVVAFDFVVAGLGRVTETYRFHGLDMTASDPALAAAIRLLHLFAGVSYLKATLAPRIVVPGSLSPRVAALFEHVLVDGLGELAHDHGIDLRGWFMVETEVVDPAPAEPRDNVAGVLVPVGGGKDSDVTLEAVRHLKPELFAVNPKGPITRTFEQAGLPTRSVTRTLDPALFDWNQRGAINGHVPITAIISAAAVVAAVAGGRGAVVMSNEASADEATVVTEDGLSINHQWSKSSAFEERFAAIVHDEVAPDLHYVSFLRPATELLIARRFSVLEWDWVFNSCNRAFHLRGQTREWCGECPKCRFVFLVLAPFSGRERIIDIVGRNLLDDPDQFDGYAELLGLTDAKPFECVGEIDECRTALRLLAEDPAWQQDAAIRRFSAEVGPLAPGELAARLRPRGVERLPSPFREAFTKAFAEAQVVTS